VSSRALHFFFLVIFVFVFFSILFLFFLSVGSCALHVSFLVLSSRFQPQIPNPKPQNTKVKPLTHTHTHTTHTPHTHTPRTHPPLCSLDRFTVRPLDELRPLLLYSYLLVRYVLFACPLLLLGRCVPGRKEFVTGVEEQELVHFFFCIQQGSSELQTRPSDRIFLRRCLCARVRENMRKLSLAHARLS
jgi:hypothetical protein